MKQKEVKLLPYVTQLRTKARHSVPGAPGLTCHTKPPPWEAEEGEADSGDSGEYNGIKILRVPTLSNWLIAEETTNMLPEIQRKGWG